MACILHAEDDENDVFFLNLAFQDLGSPHTLQSVPDGEQAIDYLEGTGIFADRANYPLPAFVILDLNMPKKTGLEVLEWIRLQPQFKSLPVVMLTSSLRQEDMDRARQLGVDDYLLKVSHPWQLSEMVKALLDRWLTHPVLSRPLHQG